MVTSNFATNLNFFPFSLYSKGMASVVTTGLIGIEVWSPTVEDVQIAKNKSSIG